MDNLERYLDQVCRGIAGPRSLRAHVRRELREHLLDSAAEHRAAGMTEEQAIERALADFGGPEQVRVELESEYGHRLMAVVIDKAMRWKEATMKAKWLWSTWAHLALALLIVAQLAFVVAAVTSILPKVEMIVAEAQIAGDGDGSVGLDAYLPGSQSFLRFLRGTADHWVWVAAILAVAWALFEWRVRSENKTLIRLSAMATASLGLMLTVAMSAAVISIPQTMAAPAMMGTPPERVVGELTSRIDASLAALDRAVRANDWAAAQAHANDAARATDQLANRGASGPAMVARPQQPRVDGVRETLRLARESMRAARQAAAAMDAPRLEAELRAFRKAYDSFPATPATRPAEP
jgi:hypothetical protein